MARPGRSSSPGPARPPGIHANARLRSLTCLDSNIVPPRCRKTPGELLSHFLLTRCCIREMIARRQHGKHEVIDGDHPNVGGFTTATNQTPCGSQAEPARFR